GVGIASATVHRLPVEDPLGEVDERGPGVVLRERADGGEPPEHLPGLLQGPGAVDLVLVIPRLLGGPEGLQGVVPLALGGVAVLARLLGAVLPRVAIGEELLNADAGGVPLRAGGVPLSEGPRELPA